MKIRSKQALIVGLTAAALTACGDSTTSTQANASVRVLMTDAPADYIASATVDIGAVELIGADGTTTTTLSDDGTDGPVDLLQLQNAATTILADGATEAGSYTQLRLIVQSAHVVLASGYQFNDGSTEKDLVVPSGAQTGIKLDLSAAGDSDGAGSLTITPGQTILVLDFDVAQSFVIEGSPATSAGVLDVVFTPTLRVVASDVAATITGTVSTSGTASVAGLTVTAEPVDQGTLEAYQTTTVTGTTSADGSFTLSYLVPGTYDVTVALEAGLVTAEGTVQVTVAPGETVAGVDFSIVDGG